MKVLLANPRGFCAGVDRAIEIVERAIALHGAPIYVRHEVVHNKFVVNDLRKKGAVFIEELDDKSSPMKAKGVGELGICGVGAAVANAIYNATGVRIRDYPITLDKLLSKMPLRA